MRNETVNLRIDAAGEATERPISIAIVAMGGQGGGVLTGWIVKLAEDAGWVAQSTSVPGVAQRTGATIYYVEMMPAQGDRVPILAQMPTPGDVDIVLASEFIEAGRSILRGIVTPERTLLIASSHRSLTIAEKSAPGEGIADSGAVAEAVGVAAQDSIIFDMNVLATANGSAISSAMFGALAASGRLPFPLAAYHAVITADGKGVAASIKTFDAAYQRALNGGEQLAPPEAASAAAFPERSRPSSPHAEALLMRLEAELAPAVVPMARAGLAKVVDFQDLRYGAEYLTLLDEIHCLDRYLGGSEHGMLLSIEAAKYLANAMAYDDVVRVADLKTRASRHRRVEREIGLRSGQIFATTEYMHPRMEEIVGLLPARLGLWLRSRAGFYAWLDRRISKGRRVRTYSPGWFLMLYLVAGLRRIRRASLRHREEVAHRADWLALATRLAHGNYALGVEVIRCQRLIKGYSDTHARGQSKFAKVTDEIQRIAARADAADWARRLRETAIREEDGGDLDGLIRTIRAFA
ncbi:MAG: indolepyruvate oxidoreductase subunit beta family protein [Novosphingobium sp.]